ncbi:MAG: SGNH/GDSL hydrolase family protein [Leeuwenhoekiella sp.]
MRYLIIFFVLIATGCSTDDSLAFAATENPEENPTDTDDGDTKDHPKVNTDGAYTYLALGDSYTIGQSVCTSCSFPLQLAEAFQDQTRKELQTKIVATTGWRTDNLIEAVKNEDLKNTYDLVTLLIGVNNQYQAKPFSQYETEFVKLLQSAIDLAAGNKDKVVVLSIPDYAFTPFGQQFNNPEEISLELDTYNAYAKSISKDLEITFLNITDITRRGLDQPNLVASDGLHPSAEAYRLFVERLLPLVETKLVKD